MSKSKYNLLPGIETFKQRRESLKLSLDDVAKFVKVSKSKIWRIEQGLNVSYKTVKSVNDFYVSLKG